jgi:hypothetical protein
MRPAMKCAQPIRSARRLMVLRRIVLMVAVLSCASLGVRPVRAEPSEADRATARSLAGEGYQALQKKDYQTAEDRFRRADALVHAPSLVVDHARALVGLGRLVEAHERFQLVLREGVPVGSPAAWRRAFGDAERELKLVEPRLAWLTVTVKGPTDPAVLVDDKQVPSAALGVRRATDPGSRRVSATAPGFAPSEQTVTLGEGEEKSLELELVPAPAAPSPSPDTAAPAQAISPENPQPKRRSNTLGYVALGLGGAGLAVGAVTGVLFLGKHSDLSSKCPDASNCPEQRLIDQYNLYGTISGVSLGVGLASSVAGMWLLLSNKGGEAAPTRPSAVTVQPTLSVGQLGVRGAF